MKILLMAALILTIGNSFAQAGRTIHGKRCDLALSIRDFGEKATKQAIEDIEAKGYKVRMEQLMYGETEFALHFGAQKVGLLSSSVQAYFLRELDADGKITRDDPRFNNGNYGLEGTGRKNALLREGVKLVPNCSIE